MSQNNQNVMGIGQQNMQQQFNNMNNNMSQNNQNGMEINPLFSQQFMNQNNMNMNQNNNYQQMFLQWMNNNNNSNNNNSNNNNNNNNSNDNNNNNNNNIKKLNNQIPKLNNDGNNNNLKNIIFSDNTGGNIIIVASGSETMENLFHIYGRKIGAERSLGRNFLFIYNARTVDIDEQRTIDKFFIKGNNTITVIEINFVTGGK